MFNLIHLLFCTVINTNYNYDFILIVTIFKYSPKFQFHLCFYSMINITFYVHWFLYFPLHVLIHNVSLLIYVRIQLLPIRIWLQVMPIMLRSV